MLKPLLSAICYTHGYLHIWPKVDHHYWSPHLNLLYTYDDETSSKTTVSGLYGPAPSIWTMFVFFYSIIALALVVISVIGFANASLGEDDGILIFIPLLIIIWLSLFVVSYLGQKKGHKQIEILHNFLENVFEQEIPFKS